MQKAGAEVLVSDIDERALQQVPAGISASRVDVSRASEVTAWLEPVAAQGVDILVNNAGTAGPTGLVEDLDDDGWRQCLAVGLDSHFYCMRAVAPGMKRRKSGAVVNLASTAGFLGMPGRSPYTAVKYAVIGLTKTWAMELGPHNVRVNAIAPGSVNGDRMDRVIAAHAASDGISEDRVRAMYSLGTSHGDLRGRIRNRRHGGLPLFGKVETGFRPSDRRRRPYGDTVSAATGAVTDHGCRRYRTKLSLPIVVGSAGLKRRSDARSTASSGPTTGVPSPPMAKGAVTQTISSTRSAFRNAAATDPRAFDHQTRNALPRQPIQ